MAINFLTKLFRKQKKGHIGLTAEEAYAPLSADSVCEEKEKDEIRLIGEEAGTDREAQKETIEAETAEPVHAPVPEPVPESGEEINQSPVSVWMYGYVEEREIAKTLIRTGIISAFRSVSEDSARFHCRLKSGANVDIDISTAPESVFAQIECLLSLFKNVHLTDRDVKNAVLMQIELFNAFAEFTLQPPYTQSDVSLLSDAVHKIAETVCGFVLITPSELCRWDGKLLISEDGRTDFTEFMPIRRSGNAVSKADADAADAARRMKSIEVLQKHGVDIPADMPVQIPEAKAKLRQSDEIVDRLAALFACALKGHAYTSPVGIAAPHAFVSSALKRLDNQYAVSRHFTAKEAEYIVRGRDMHHNSFRLRMESCQVLLWALGLINIGWPSERADTEDLLRIIRDADTDMLLKISKPRPLNMILSMHDVTYRLHSICVRTDEETLRQLNLDHDVIYERHYALNWLLTADGITDWDKVIPKT